MIENLSTRFACECTSEDVCRRLKTDPVVGLGGHEVERRLKLFGPNELSMQKTQSIFSKYVEQVGVCVAFGFAYLSNCVSL